MKNKGYKSFTKKINIYQTKELGHLLSFREGVSHLGGPRREYKLEMVHDSFRKNWMRWAKVLLKHIFSQYIKAFKKSFTWRNDRRYKATIHMEHPKGCAHPSVHCGTMTAAKTLRHPNVHWLRGGQGGRACKTEHSAATAEKAATPFVATWRGWQCHTKGSQSASEGHCTTPHTCGI